MSVQKATPDDETPEEEYARLRQRYDELTDRDNYDRALANAISERLAELEAEHDVEAEVQA